MKSSTKTQWIWFLIHQLFDFLRRKSKGWTVNWMKFKFHATDDDIKTLEHKQILFFALKISFFFILKIQAANKEMKSFLSSFLIVQNCVTTADGILLDLSRREIVP